MKDRIETAMQIACIHTLQHEPRTKVNPKVVFKDSERGTNHSTKNKTFIMRWNPEISNHKIVDFEDGMESFFEHDFYYDWSIWDYKDVQVGDKFFMVKVGNGNTGIVMQGTIISKPYKDNDWSGKGREVRYVRMNPECMIHPNNADLLLSTQELDSAIPGIKWNEGHSGILLNNEQAQQLDIAWDSYLEHLLSYKAI